MKELRGSLDKLHETENDVDVEWKIDYSSTNLFVYSEFQSPPFTWSSLTWYIQISHTVDSIKLYLRKPKSEKPITVVFKFSIRLMNGSTEMRCSLIKNFTESEGGFGTAEFIHKSELEERQHVLLPKGILTISCSIAHLDILIKSPQNEKYENLDALSSDMKALRKCYKSSDVTIIVGEQSYLVHKNILAARSPVFAEMFEHNVEMVNSSVINIKDCDSTYFKDFIFYLYTGKVKNFSSDNCCYLYKIAEKYKVQTLKVLCVKFMKKNISLLNLFNFIIIANQFKDAELISLTKDFFNENALEFIKGDDWKKLVEHNFHEANGFLINMLETLKKGR